MMVQSIHLSLIYAWVLKHDDDFTSELYKIYNENKEDRKDKMVKTLIEYFTKKSNIMSRAANLVDEHTTNITDSEEQFDIELESVISRFIKDNVRDMNDKNINEIANLFINVCKDVKEHFNDIIDQENKNIKEAADEIQREEDEKKYFCKFVIDAQGSEKVEKFSKEEKENISETEKESSVTSSADMNIVNEVDTKEWTTSEDKSWASVVTVKSSNKLPDSRQVEVEGNVNEEEKYIMNIDYVFALTPGIRNALMNNPKNFTMMSLEDFMKYEGIDKHLYYPARCKKTFIKLNCFPDKKHIRVCDKIYDKNKEDTSESCSGCGKCVHKRNFECNKIRGWHCICSKCNDVSKILNRECNCDVCQAYLQIN